MTTKGQIFGWQKEIFGIILKKGHLKKIRVENSKIFG